MTDLPELALQSGATQLGEDGPDGAHWIFSREELERFAALLGAGRPGASARDVNNRPLAAPGLISYRCRNQYGWTMIGARDHDDAFREALRSDDLALRSNLQVWDGKSYVPVLPALPY